VVVWHHFVDHGIVMELVHPSEVIDGCKLVMPQLIVLYPLLHLYSNEVVEVSGEGMVLVEVGEIIKLNVGDSLLLEGFVFFG
jgi:hypothetical protein